MCKKTVLLGILSIVAFHISYCQNSNYLNLIIAENYDSIVNIVESIPNEQWAKNDINNYAYALNKSDKKLKSIEALKKATSLYPNDSTYTLKLADAFYDLGDYIHAKPLLEKSVAQFPNQSVPLYQLSQIYTFNKEYNNAIQLLNNQYSKDSTNITIIKALIDNCIKTDSISEAIDFCQNALKLTPGNLKLSHQLCQLYSKEKMYDSIFSICDPILLSDNLNKSFLSIKAKASFQIEDYETACNIYDLLLSIGDSSLMTLRSHGLSKYKMEDYETAIKSLTIVYNNLPQDYTSCFHIAKSYSKIPDKEKQALIYFDWALELLNNEEQVAIIYNNIGDVYKYSKDYINAEKYYKYALSTAPSHTTNLYALATLNDFHIKNQRNAMNYYNKYIEAIEKDTTEKDSASLRFRQTEETIKYSKDRIAQIKEDLFFNQ